MCQKNSDVCKKVSYTSWKVSGSMTRDTAQNRDVRGTVGITVDNFYTCKKSPAKPHLGRNRHGKDHGRHGTRVHRSYDTKLPRQS